jgi:NTP pyrophosphatase (non-canonical NTP hydrolase)
MENLSLNEYQKESSTFAIYPKEDKPPMYPYLALAEEAGEVCGKLAKAIRKGDLEYGPSLELNTAILDECGDVLWNLSQIVNDLGYNLEYVARMNLDKLRDRKERGVIDGKGDKR